MTDPRENHEDTLDEMDRLAGAWDVPTPDAEEHTEDKTDDYEPQEGQPG